jgi:hypothetical protein
LLEMARHWMTEVQQVRSDVNVAPAYSVENPKRLIFVAIDSYVAVARGSQPA